MIRPQTAPGEQLGFAFGPFRLDVSRQTLWRDDERVALGNRAFAILHGLLERQGELVSKAELYKLAWPDISVDEANLRVQVAMLRKALGEYGANITATTGLGYQFIGSVTRTSSVAGSGSRRLGPPDGIGQLLGREQDLASAILHLRQRRLVAIVGPGGIGKTTLAQTVAESLQNEYQDGVCFVDLGLVNEPGLASAALAAALKTPLNAQDPLESLLAYLESRDLLIVLDCCEHVVDAAADLAEQILKVATRIRILVTSREALRAQGEFVLELSALQTPPPTESITATEAMTFPAVQLFVRCAALNAKEFEISDNNAMLIAEVCQRLDGIPLAIELVAAFVGFLGLSATRDKLDQRFSVLTLNRRTSLARHRTLSATMDWSYDLLSENERTVLRRLSVFARRFTIEAAIEVALCGEIDASAAAGRVIDLAAKSLLAVDRRGGGAKYHLLETTRVYARQQLAPREEKKQSAVKHARYYLHFLEQFDWESYDPEQDREAISDCIEEVRVALDWAYSNDDCQDLAVTLSLAAERAWLELAFFTECIQRMRQALARLSQQEDSDPRLQMKALTALATAQINAHSPDMDPSSLEEALSIADRFGDKIYQMRGSWGLYHSCMMTQDPRRALYARRVQSLSLEQPGPSELQMIGVFLGWAHLSIGDLVSAKQHFDKFLTSYISPPRSHAVLFGYAKRVTAKCGLAIVLWLQGRPERALELVEESLAEAEKLRHGATTFYALGYGTCFISMFSGNFDVGRSHLLALGDAARVYRDWKKLVVAYKGMVARQEGDQSLALECLENALTGVSPAKAFVLYPLMLFELADAHCIAGNLEASERAVELALDCSTGPDDVIVVCNALRVKAAIIAARAGDAAAQRVETLLLESIRIARTQRALTLELKSTTELARLWNSQGRSADAKRALEAIVYQMTEGFQLPLLLEARALIKSFDGTTEGF